MSIKVKIGPTQDFRVVATGEKKPVIVPDSIVLGVDTLGDYVARIDAGDGIVVLPETDTETANLVIAHANTSTELSTTNDVLEFISNADIDQFGHITAFSSTGLDANNFVSTDGVISSKNITLGDTSFTLGDSITSLSGLSFTNVELITGANNIVDFGGSTITNISDPIEAGDAVNRDFLFNQLNLLELSVRVVEDPVDPLDAANKRYVDATAQGLVVRPSALAATTADLGGTFLEGNTSVADTITIPATEFLNIDGVITWQVGDSILVKDQTDPAQNGSYDIVQVGNTADDWILERARWSREYNGVPGSFEFVTDGTVNRSTGWVATVADAETFELNTDAVTWVQFSGAGTYDAGTGLTLDGTVFNVDESQTLSQINAVNGSLEVVGNGALTLPKGITAERPAPVVGMIRFNEQDNQFEGYDGLAWSGLGGVIDVDQDTKIVAETSPGSDNDELQFYTGGTLTAKFDSTSANFYGDVNISGHITIGDLPADSITVIADFTSDLDPDTDRTYNLGNESANWNIAYIDTLRSSNEVLNISGTGALKLPTGTNAERPVGQIGMLRFNSEDQRFEGYDGNQWAGLAGSVVDLDRNTYIVAETSTGADNNELDFYTAGLQRLQIDSTGNLRFGSNLDSLIANYTTGEIIVNSKITSDDILFLDSANSIIDVSNNRITNVATPVNPTDAVNLAYLGDSFSSGLTVIDGNNTYVDGVDLTKSPTLELGRGLELESIDTANNTLKLSIEQTGVQPGLYGNNGYTATFRVDDTGRINFITDIPLEFQANVIIDFTEATMDIIGLALNDGVKEGVAVLYDDSSNTFNFFTDNFDVTLDGDITGTATVVRNSNTIITTSYDYTNLDARYANLTGDTFTGGISGTTAQFTGNVEGSRFVDSDNGTYFVDPSGTSRINTMEVGYGSVFSQMKFRDGPGSFSTLYATNGQIGFLDNTFNFAAYAERATGNWVVQNGDVRAERFVDADAQTYFVHPGGTDSKIRQLWIENSAKIDNIEIGTTTQNTIETLSGSLILNGEGISLNAEGLDIDANNSKIVNVADPVLDTDAANKRYVDSTAQGLRIAPQALAATTADLGGSYSSINGGTITIPAVTTLNVDGVTDWSLGDRILVKDQSTTLENGIYEIAQVGDVSTDWILRRNQYANESYEVPGTYEFVTDGTTNAGTGWVITVADAETFVLGSDAIIWYQFSGAGTYTAGSALTLTGTEFSISDQAITNAKLANPSFSIIDENGQTQEINLGTSLTFEGVDGVDTTVTAGQVAIAVTTIDGGTF